MLKVYRKMQMTGDKKTLLSKPIHNLSFQLQITTSVFQTVFKPSSAPLPVLR